MISIGFEEDEISALAGLFQTTQFEEIDLSHSVFSLEDEEGEEDFSEILLDGLSKQTGLKILNLQSTGIARQNYEHLLPASERSSQSRPLSPRVMSILKKMSPKGRRKKINPSQTVTKDSAVSLFDEESAGDEKK